MAVSLPPLQSCSRGSGVTPMMHAFWAIEDQEHRTQELVNFTKKIALIGGGGIRGGPGENRGRPAPISREQHASCAWRPPHASWSRVSRRILESRAHLA